MRYLAKTSFADDLQEFKVTWLYTENKQTILHGNSRFLTTQHIYTEARRVTRHSAAGALYNSPTARKYICFVTKTIPLLPLPLTKLA